ncbi:hypothetical protein BDZ97DRAFT_1904837 [Flammula alnicola]|nr:hypothetical protein BDZ97DRAFT_1904837 [Flammula alnicola]
MSQIIACDAPLLSPPLFSPTADNFAYPYYNLPPSPPNSEGSHITDSPVPTSRMLKMRMTPDSAADSELCLPTHQVFDFPELARPPTPPSRSPSLCVEVNRPLDDRHLSSSDLSSCGAKRSASPAPSATKKRAVGERINSKDFVPPDVSGLSKREARLVKNRAAAFLSRQRKREEFECMEVRVAELEQENARLLALTQNGNSITTPQNPQSDTHLVSEVEQLKAQLAAAKERERSLSAQLARDVSVKLEATEPQFSSLSSPPRSTTVPSAHKSGASLGLMVLLCALPTLLSMRMQSTAPTSFAIPNPFPASSASTFDYNSYFPNDYDWTKTTGSSLMDLDADHHQHKAPTTTTTVRKLQFAGTDSTDLGGLGDLDISFDTSPSDDGKIRVRIHPPSAASSRSASPGASSSSHYSSSSYGSPASNSVHSPSLSSLAMWSGAESLSSSQFGSSLDAFAASPCAADDPFLGLGVSPADYGMMAFAADGEIRYAGASPSSSSSSLSASSLLEYGRMTTSDAFSIPDSTTGARRRVRIALKSMPQAGGEGGEWEVQLC